MEFSSPTISSLAPALLKVQTSLRPLYKDASNPFLNSKYVTLSTVLETCREALSENGILLIQRVVASAPGTVTVETRFIHAPSSEWIAGLTCIPIPEEEQRMNSSQAVGSCISYGRRYGLMSMLGLAAVDDDTDAEFRTTPAPPRKTPSNSDSKRTSNPSKDSRFSSFLPEIDGVTFAEVIDQSTGKKLVFASGKTVSNKDELKNHGFRWSPERKTWWRESAAS